MQRGHGLAEVIDGTKGNKIVVCGCGWVTAPCRFHAGVAALQHHVQRRTSALRTA